MMKRPQPSLLARISLLFALIGAVPLMIAGGGTVWVVWEGTLSELRRHHMDLSLSLALQIREVLRAHEEAVVRLSELPGRMGEPADSSRFIPLMRDQMDSYASGGIHVAAWALCGKDGGLRAFFPMIPSFHKLDFLSFPEVKNAVENDVVAWSSALKFHGFMGPVAVVAIPRGHTVVIGFIPLEALSRRLQSLERAFRTEIVVWDSQGAIVSHPDSSVVLKRQTLRDIPPLGGLLGRGAELVEYEYEGSKFLGAIANVKDVGWKVLVAEPEAAVLRVPRGLLQGLLTIMGPVLVLALVAALWSTKLVMRPMEVLIEAFERMGNGELLGDTMPQSPWREFEGAIKAFGDMACRIKEREDALKASEERYKLLVDNAQDGILIAQDRMLKFVNPRMVELLEYPEEEITSRPFTDFIHPDDREIVLERHVRRLSGEKGLPTSYQFKVVTRSGVTRWVEIRVLPVTWQNRPAALSFLTDITQKLESERALRESEERYRSLVENSPDGIFIAELPGGEIRFVNQAICEIFGYSRDEALGGRPWEVLAEEEVEKALCLLRKASEGAAIPSTPFSFKAFRKDKTGITVEVRFARIRYQGKNSIQAMVRDVTEHELLQRQLEHSQRMQALGTLASGVAHEFNNILAAIQGFAQLLQYVVGSEGDAGWYIQEIVSSCQRASSLTHKMLTLARTDEDHKVILKLNQIVEKAQGLLAQTLPPTITVNTDLTGGLPFVLGDPTQLDQVLLNLVLNAKDAMPQGGTIVIGTRFTELTREFSARHTYVEPGRYVEFYVEDEGVGIPQEILGRIFEPFFTTKEPGKGTGLGLSVSYSIVKNHRGFIIAQSPPEGKERGSILRVFLPPYETAEEPEPHTSDQGPAPKGKGERILIVDDEPQMRRILKEALERHNYRVEETADGQIALLSYLRAMDQGRPFDAVIMDLAMPVRDGAWASARILDVDPKARILIATGHTDEKLIPQELTSKAKAMLKKPFDIGILLTTLRECLEGDKAP